MAEAPIDHLTALFAARGAGEYHGEAVTQLEHALQCAGLAERARASNALIVAALLHDVGHLLHVHGEDAANEDIDDRHEELGFRYLKRHFGSAVCEPVRLHVPAKRYLAFADSAYVAILSPASIQSLALQGGPMSEDEAKSFELNPHFKAACALRRWDDAAKIPGLATKELSDYLPMIERELLARTDVARD